MQDVTTITATLTIGIDLGDRHSHYCVLDEARRHPPGIHSGVRFPRVNEIVRGKRGVSPETACLFAAALGTTPEFWVNLQTAHDLVACKPSRSASRLRRTA